MLKKARKTVDGDDDKICAIVEANLNRTEENWLGSISSDEADLLLKQIDDFMDYHDSTLLSKLNNCTTI